MSKIIVGLVGCGNISDIYIKSMALFDNFEIDAVADLDRSRAEAKREQYHLSRVLDFTSEMLTDRSIDVILNLTIPTVHNELTMMTINSGKHVYSEKPLCLTYSEATAMAEAAKSKNVLVGCAPDTFLGGGLQTAVDIINSGEIGEPISASANMLCHGHEHWHPDPAFYYKRGGGPMFDMGPYYLTALVAMMGPVTSLNGKCITPFSKRVVKSEPKRGEEIIVEVATHVTGLLSFRSGAVATIVTSFDTWGSLSPKLEVHGTLGSLILPDPNTFGGPLKIKKEGMKEFEEIPITRGYTENSRGLGLSDMVNAIITGQPYRCNIDMAKHVIEIMESIHVSSQSGETVVLSSTVERPAPMPA